MVGPYHKLNLVTGEQRSILWSASLTSYIRDPFLYAKNCTAELGIS